MNKKTKIIAVFIAYKAEKTLEKFWDEFPKQYFDECILVDDASPDKTFEIAKKLKGLKSYQNKTNLGYGGNIRKAVAIALNQGADIIVDIHPDGEYKPSAIFPALEKIQKEGYEFVMGNRFSSTGNPLKSGMYVWKIFPLITLSFIDRMVLKVNISDFHQGFRVYSRKLFEKVNFEKNSNDYIFSFELIAQAAFAKIKTGEVPVETSYTGEKRGASFVISCKYALETFYVLLKYLLAKINIKSSLFMVPPNTFENRLAKIR